MQQDTQQYANELKQFYLNKKLQWITPPSSEIKTGSIVTCVDIIPSGNVAMAKFSDGSWLSAEMIDEHMGDGNNPVLEPPEQNPQYQQQPQQPNQQSQQQQNNTQQSTKSNETVDLFANFDKTKKSMEFNLDIELPDFNLIKLMYQNAADKNKFLKQLSEYTLNSVNTETIKKSWEKMLTEENQQEKEIVYNDNSEQKNNN